MLIEKFKPKKHPFDNNDGVILYRAQNEPLESQENSYNNDGIFEKPESNPRIKQLTLRLFSLLNSKNFHSKNQTKQNIGHHNLIHDYQNSKLINYLENLRHSTQSDYEFDSIQEKQTISSPAIARTTAYYLSSTDTTTSYYSSSLHDLNYKNNELYSIFVSMFTAAIFVFFIMWRWLKMKSDLRKALREQSEIQRQQRLNSQQTPPTTPPSTSTNVSPLSLQQNHFFSSTNYRENLNVLLNQLNEGELRTDRQNRQIIDAAKYCLQQLRYQSRSRSTNRNLYSLNGNTNNTNNSNFGSHLNNQQTVQFQIQPLIENFNSTSSIMNNFNASSNELPPSYDSIMKKSSSLPSYYHLTLK